jgi:hypothetical protein
MKKFILVVAVVALAVAFALVTGAAAQTEAVSTVDGFIWGNSGGAHQVWDLAVPQNTDVNVSVEYNPCAPPNSVAFVAYSSDGQVVPAHQTAHCTKELAFNTGSSESLELKLSYYEHGQQLYYVVKATGLDLAAVAAPEAEAVVEEEVKVSEVAAEEAVTETAAVAVEEAAPAEEAVVEEAAPVNVSVVKGTEVEGNVLGTSGGGHVKYDVMLTGGQEYNAIMNYHFDVGGDWPAVGFTVWGPDGVVAMGKHMYGTPAEATFVAPDDAKYTVDVYNYHPGLTLYWNLQGLPIPMEAAE